GRLHGRGRHVGADAAEGGGHDAVESSDQPYAVGRLEPARRRHDQDAPGSEITDDPGQLVERPGAEVDALGVARVHPGRRHQSSPASASSEMPGARPLRMNHSYPKVPRNASSGMSRKNRESVIWLA